MTVPIMGSSLESRVEAPGEADAADLHVIGALTYASHVLAFVLNRERRW